MVADNHDIARHGARAQIRAVHLQADVLGAVDAQNIARPPKLVICRSVKLKVVKSGEPREDSCVCPVAICHTPKTGVSKHPFGHVAAERQVQIATHHLVEPQPAVFVRDVTVAWTVSPLLALKEREGLPPPPGGGTWLTGWRHGELVRVMLTVLESAALTILSILTLALGSTSHQALKDTATRLVNGRRVRSMGAPSGSETWRWRPGAPGPSRRRSPSGLGWRVWGGELETGGEVEGSGGVREAGRDVTNRGRAGGSEADGQGGRGDGGHDLHAARQRRSVIAQGTVSNIGLLR